MVERESNPGAFSPATFWRGCAAEITGILVDVDYFIEDVGSPNADDLDALLKGLTEFNRSKLGDFHREKVGCFAKDGAGALVGGIYGAIAWDWLRVELLWVREDCRSRGLGGTLLKRAEEHAQTRGVFRYRVETASFQALEFYLKAGYEVFAELADFPPGGKNYYLRKVQR